jgi:ABC-type branched-subunit amino acid transport system permease subunit/ABC-type branched-subunit amino acid transport system ATPase component
MDYIAHVLVLVCLYSILAVSFNLLIGFAGLIAFAQAIFYALGAYATATIATRFGAGFPLTLLASIALTAGLGTLVTLPALRVSGEYLIIVTLGLQVVVDAVLLNLSSITGGADGLRNVPPIALFGARLTHAYQFLPLAALCAIAVFLVARRLTHSPFGRSLEAMRENELAAGAAGKNPVLLKSVTFAFSAGLAAVAGCLYAHYFTLVSPDSFSLSQTVYVLAMVTVGGRGNLLGSVIGAAVLVALPEFFKLADLPTDVADHGRALLYGLTLVAMMRVRPQGLLSRNRATRHIPAAASSSVLKKIRPRPLAPDNPTITIEARGLRKSFGGITAVAHLDISLRSGKVTGLVGPNGAGKTTAFNLLTGFLRPDAGTLLLRGEKLDNLRPHQMVKIGVARSFQDLRLFTGMTVLENILVSLPHQLGDNVVAVFFQPAKVARDDNDNKAEALNILKTVGLADRAEADVRDLSYAEEKLLVIARLIATRANVILFDEPLSGLDHSAIEKLIPIIRGLANAGKTVCIIEHNLDAVRALCDTVIFLDEGRVLAEGPPAELIANTDLARRYFG